MITPFSKIEFIINNFFSYTSFILGNIFLRRLGRGGSRLIFFSIVLVQDEVFSFVTLLFIIIERLFLRNILLDFSFETLTSMVSSVKYELESIIFENTEIFTSLEIKFVFLFRPYTVVQFIFDHALRNTSFIERVLLRRGRRRVVLSIIVINSESFTVFFTLFIDTIIFLREILNYRAIITDTVSVIFVEKEYRGFETNTFLLTFI